MRLKRLDLKDAKGFTLIEVSIGLTILGLLAVALIMPYQMYQKNKIRATSDMTFEAITAALAAYVERNGFYPLPADPRLGPGDANFGAGTGFVSAGGVSMGAVPVRDLNLPYRMIGDPYGSKLTYAVTTVLATDATAYDNAGGVGAVRVLNWAGADMTAARAQFIIVSHGPDMKGAYPVAGAPAPLIPCDNPAIAGTARDAINCTVSADFRDAEYAPKNNAEDANHFDDMVSYTLLRKETTMWKIRENAGTGGGVNISNRNMANVGIGTAAPAAKLHIAGGDMDIQTDSTTGCNTVPVAATCNTGTLEVTGNISAARDVKAKEEVKASNFSGIP